MTPWMLALLVLVDGTLCGFRAAAGRNPRLFLRGYYASSMWRAAFVSLGVSAGFALVAVVVRQHSDAEWQHLLAAGGAMVLVYGVFATVVLTALALYGLGHFDVGVLATVLVLGPLTLTRPLVIVVGGVCGAWAGGTFVSAAFSLAGAAVMLSFERLLALGRPPWRGLLP